MFQPEEDCAYLPWGYNEFYQPRQQLNLLPFQHHYQQPQHLPPLQELPPALPLPPNKQLFMQYLGQYSCPVIDYSRLTSFLEVDNSFLTLWNWKADDVPEGFKKYMRFEPGSLFMVEVPTANQTR